ncbi:MAG: hypothetical protein J6P84_00950 [Alphaproteobacteria bacterium]|nr:hypothetical protein [Alphaproteobacteria bacterium]
MEKLTIKIPFEDMTFVYKNNNGFRIQMKGVDVLDYQSGLISKSYEEVLFFLFYNYFPGADDLAFCKTKINEGFNKGINIVSDTKLRVAPMLSFQDLVLKLKINQNTDPFVIVGIIFAFVISIINKRLRNPTELKLDMSKGLIQNFQKFIKFPEDTLFEKIMIAWMDAGNTPSEAAFVFNRSLETTMASSLSAAIGAMSGLKHTSSCIQILKNLLILKSILVKHEVDCGSITSMRRCKNIIKDFFQSELEKGNLLYGFGHYFFKGPEPFIDPRIKLIQRAIKAQKCPPDLLNILNLSREICGQGMLHKKGCCEKIYLPINSDGYWSIYLYNNFCRSAVVEDFLELIPLFTALSRATGLISYGLMNQKGSPIITKEAVC